MKIITYLNYALLVCLISACSNKQSSNEISASGTIEATDVTVSSRAAGQITEILFKEGDKIKKDDMLLKVDHESLDIQLRQAEAGVEQAEAQLRLLQAGARREDIKLAQEQVNLAQINLKQAETEKERVIKLHEANVLTQQQYEDALTKFDQVMNQS
ncbi:MAG: biotin/lipoyl-binding protein, partial [bacterium]